MVTTRCLYHCLWHLHMCNTMAMNESFVALQLHRSNPHQPLCNLHPSLHMFPIHLNLQPGGLPLSTCPCPGYNRGYSSERMDSLTLKMTQEYQQDLREWVRCPFLVFLKVMVCERFDVYYCMSVCLSMFFVHLFVHVFQFPPCLVLPVLQRGFFSVCSHRAPRSELLSVRSMHGKRRIKCP